MSEDKKKDYDRKIERTKKIIILIVVPILLTTSGLMAISGVGEEKPSYVEILPQIDLKCYNVNWFGTYGFQLTYKNSIEEIALKLEEYDMDFSNKDFFENEQVVDYLIRYCPHVDSKLEVPDEYDPMIGLPALDKCLQKKEGIFGSEDYCLQFKS